MADPTATASKSPRKRAAPKTETTTKTTVDKVKEQASAMASEAGDVARKAANTGKNKAVEALGGVARLADDAAKAVDDHFGPAYGDYARRASDSVNKAANSLQSKEIDDLIADTTAFVRKNPVVAIGAAAAVGFFLTRMLRGGGDND